MTLVYEDRIVKASLPADGAANGHVIVQPQREVKRLSDLPAADSAHLFLVASYSAAILFQGLQAEGTNIIVEEGDKLAVHVVARKTGDGLSFVWPPKKLEQGVMAEAAEKIKDKTFYIGKVSSKADKAAKESGAEKGTTKTSDENESKPPKDGDAKGEKKDDKPKDDGSRPSKEAVADAEEEENYLIQQLIRIP